MPARTSISAPGAVEPQPISSQRMNCTRTGVPASCDISAAACAASSVLHAVAEAAAHRDGGDAHLVLGQADHRRDGLARLVGALRAREDPRALRGHVGDRAAARRSACGRSSASRSSADTTCAAEARARVDVAGVDRGSSAPILPALSSARMPWNSLPLPGSALGGSAHLTFSWAAAWIAAYSVRRDDAEEVVLANDPRAAGCA